MSLTFNWEYFLKFLVVNGLHFLTGYTFKWLSFILTCCLMNWNVIIQFLLEVSDHSIVASHSSHILKYSWHIIYYCSRKQSSGKLAKSVGKQLCRSLFFSKVAGRLKKRFRHSFFKSTSGRLLWILSFFLN